MKTEFKTIGDSVGIAPPSKPNLEPQISLGDSAGIALSLKAKLGTTDFTDEHGFFEVPKLLGGLRPRRV
jgi:hypothetical protein